MVRKQGACKYLWQGAGLPLAGGRTSTDGICMCLPGEDVDLQITERKLYKVLFIRGVANVELETVACNRSAAIYNRFNTSAMLSQLYHVNMGVWGLASRKIFRIQTVYNIGKIEEHRICLLYKIEDMDIDTVVNVFL